MIVVALKGKSFFLLSRYSWKSDNFRESYQKRSKELILKRMRRGLRMITLQEAIKKRLILPSQCSKMNDWMAP